MSKRLTDTEKWKQPFFKSLPIAYKLLWYYIHDDCDFCGVWTVDLEVARLRIGFDLNEKEAIKIFGNRVIVIQGGAAWFIPEFVENNYGELNTKNVIHQKVLKRLTMLNVTSANVEIDTQTVPHNSPGSAPEDKEKEEGKEECIILKTDKEPAQLSIPVWPSFEDFWTMYDKKIDRIKTNKAWDKIPQAEKEAAMFHAQHYKAANPDRKFRKDPFSYLYNKSYLNEIYEIPTVGPRKQGTNPQRTVPFTNEISNTVRDKFAEAARSRNKPSADKHSPEPGES